MYRCVHVHVSVCICVLGVCAPTVCMSNCVSVCVYTNTHVTVCVSNCVSVCVYVYARVCLQDDCSAQYVVQLWTSEAPSLATPPTHPTQSSAHRHLTALV